MKIFKMLLAISMFLSVLAPNAALAQSMNDATALQERVASVFFAISGVNGVAISLCDRYTGAENFDGAPCIAVSFEDRRSLNTASELFSSPFKLENVWVRFYYSGPARPYPGVSVRN